MNMLNVSFNICGVVFISFLMAFYFMKKSMPNIENKIYKFILISSLLIPASDLVFWISCYYLKDYHWIIEIEGRTFLTFLLCWLVFLVYYIIVVTNRDKKFVKNVLAKNDKITIWPFITIVVIALIELLFSFSCTTDPTTGVVLYTEGTVYYFNVFLISAFIDISIIAAILGKQKFDINKAAPVFVFMFYEITMFAIYLVNRTICIFTLSSTLTSYLMFFTIENPDLKLIKQLTLAKIQAEKASKAKSDFLASMSHEIRTPLNAIIGFTQMIKESNDLNQVRNDSNDILQASNELLTILNGIMDVNALDNSSMEINNSNYNIKKLIEELESNTRIRLGSKQVEFKVDYQNDIPNTLYGDSNMLKRIITNLLTNAIKYTNNGSITLKVSTITNNKFNLKIEVIDTGIGIKEEDKEKIFDRFYRAEEFMDTDIAGTGLGLSITKELVELLEGKITVDSTYNVGSTFTVIIPQKVVEEEIL